MKGLLLLALIFTLPLFPQETKRGQLVDGFVAEVDGRIITMGDVISSTRQEMQELEDEHRGPQQELIRKKINLFNKGVDRLIERKLMLAKFEDMGATLPASSVRDQKERIIRERFDNDRGLLIRALRRMGMTEEDWEKDLKENLVQQSMIQEFIQMRIQITPAEIRKRYEETKEALQNDVEIRLRAIAFRPARAGEEDARTERIATVRRLLNEGASFADVAIEYSEGPKAQAGGDQGWKRLDALPDAIRMALSSTEVGEVTDLVELPTQAYLFLIENQRGGDVQTLAEAQRGIENELRSEKYDRIYQEWTQSLRNEFPVHRYRPDLSAVTGE